MTDKHLTCPDCHEIVNIWNDEDFDNVFLGITAECTNWNCGNKWNIFGSPIKKEDNG